MQTLRALILISFLLVLAQAPQAPAQSPPLQQSVTYRIHDQPDDPDSPVIFTISCLLEAAAWEGSSIGWRVLELRFHEVAADGALSTSWRKEFPEVDSADGLWWVSHPELNAPQPADFRRPPPLIGVAAANTEGAAQLHFTFVGASYEPLPGAEAFAVPAALTYSLRPADQSAPLLSGTAEPVDIPPADDPPSGTG